MCAAEAQHRDDGAAPDGRGRAVAAARAEIREADASKRAHARPKTRGGAIGAWARFAAGKAPAAGRQAARLATTDHRARHAPTGVADALAGARGKGGLTV